MRFCLLGPLEVRDDQDHPVRIGEGRQRGVLVLLLLHRNESIASEWLVDALWGEAPPATAAKVLQNHVAQLRRGLGDREGRRLQTHGRAYALRVEPGELDVERFEQLVREGSAALEHDRPAEAAARLREGLALWRGPPLADVAYEDFAQPEIAGLEERRAVALERRIDADLALGRHADLLGELGALVSRYPLREHLRGQRILALYRCGRQADALEAFREARRLLGRGGRRRARPGAARPARRDPAPGRLARPRARTAAARARCGDRSGAGRPRAGDGGAPRALGARPRRDARPRRHHGSRRHGQDPAGGRAGGRGPSLGLRRPLRERRARRRRRWRRSAQGATRRARRCSSSTTPTGASERWPRSGTWHGHRTSGRS